MKALVFEIILEQPVFIARPAAGEENSSESYEFIPGATIRGALIGFFLSKNKQADVSHDQKYRKWFFTGEHCFLNAYPITPGDGARMLPRPLSWRIEKDSQRSTTFRIYDYAVDVNAGLKTPVLPSVEYARYDAGDVKVYNTKRIMVPHNASITRQVKKADQSFVFVYDALAPGQTLSTAVVGNDVENLQKELGLTGGQELFLGGSRSANYGRVRLANVRLEKDWKEYEPGSQPPSDKMILTLLSDTILVDQNGQPAANPDDLIGRKHWRSYQKTRLTGGFNRKWGLPLPQAVALQAGSVFVYETNGVDISAVQKLAEKGIGERCAEGFGRVAVNWNTEGQPRAEWLVEKAMDEKVETLTPSSEKLLLEMAKRKLRLELDDRILEVLGTLEISSPPANSQLAQLRQAAREAASAADLEPLRERLTQMKPAAKKQFEKARVKEGTGSEESLDQWLKIGLDKDFTSNFWRLIKIEVPGMGGKKYSDTSDELKSIKYEFIARFIDAMMRKLVRERKDQPQKEEETE